jgi:hypothetical protein
LASNWEVWIQPPDTVPTHTHIERERERERERESERERQLRTPVCLRLFGVATIRKVVEVLSIRVVDHPRILVACMCVGGGVSDTIPCKGMTQCEESVSA